MSAARNPFAVARLPALPFRFPAGDDLESTLARLATLNHRAALVGGHGRGKSTMLRELADALADRFPRQRFHKLDTRHGRLPREFARRPRGELLLLDGAEQLSPLAWGWLRWRARAAAGLIITTHAPGRLPTLIDCPARFDIVEAFLDHCLGPDRAPDWTAAAREIFEQYQGDLHQIPGALYERWNRLESRSHD